MSDSTMFMDSLGNKVWYKNGVFHRLDCPAVELNTGDKWWYLYGIPCTESEYNKWISNLPLLYWNRFKEGKWI